LSASTPIWREGTTLERVRAIQARTMAEHLEIVFTELGPDWLSATMPVTERTCQPMRVLHGGASVVLAETIASTAANLLVDSSRCSLVGQEINANHLRAAPLGELVTGTARPFHVGARSQVWGVEIVDSRGRRVCVSRMTLALVERPLVVPFAGVDPGAEANTAAAPPRP
jgi:1,4-dihydroxy-2-naphthoyl-CoA hydrolase